MSINMYTAELGGILKPTAPIEATEILAGTTELFARSWARTRTTD